MRLRVSLPDRIVVDEETTKVVAEAQNGHFGLLPRHIDFVAGLVPGILSYWPADGRERFLAIDEGTLVKLERLVLVSVRNAIPGDDLETLRDTVRTQFVELDERRRAARSALARLEAGVVRRLIELRKEA
jgi:F-type H+-transporting ATPase subunit epsilon